MSPDVLLISLSNIVWGILSVLVFVVCLLLIIVILLQDSRDTGLASTFGGGGGGSALLGARMQKDLANFTVILSIILGVSLLLMGFLTTYQRRKLSAGDRAKLPTTEAPAEPKASKAPPEETPGASAQPPASEPAGGGAAGQAESKSP